MTTKQEANLSTQWKTVGERLGIHPSTARKYYNQWVAEDERKAS